MSGIPWTDEELDIVRNLAKKGHGAEVMSEVLPKRTRDAILATMRKNGIRVVYPDPEINYEVYDLAMGGTKCEPE